MNMVFRSSFGVSHILGICQYHNLGIPVTSVRPMWICQGESVLSEEK